MATKKKIRPGSLEANLEEHGITIHYDTEEYSILADGSLELESKKPGVKLVKVKDLTGATDISALAANIIEKSKLLSSSKQQKVEDVLKELLSKSGGAEAGDAGRSSRSDQATRRSRDHVAPVRTMHQPAAPSEPSATSLLSGSQEDMASGEGSCLAVIRASQSNHEHSRLSDLDSYMEDLYEEDLQKKVTATGMISHLFRQTNLFEELLSHRSLLPSLARVLREDGKRSLDLCINIVAAFFSLSNFSQFHPIIMEQQVGAMTMDMLELEIKRTEYRIREEGLVPAALAQKFLQARKGAIKLNDRDTKQVVLLQKQDRLLYLCLYMLLNLAEDVGVEKKMKKKNLVAMVVKMLERNNVELLILAVTFLKKLSIYGENVEKMKACKVVDRLVRLVPVGNDVLMMAVLRLLHNLSFNKDMRDHMVHLGVIPRAVDLMRDPRFQPVVMGLLYHVSMEDKFKTMFTYTDALAIVYEMLLRVNDLRTTPELIALAVNLTQTPRNAETICEGERFDRLLKRAVQTGDELTFKVLRNCSQQNSKTIKTKFAPYFEQLVGLLHAQDITGDLFVEVLGTLANLNIPEFDFLNLVKRHDLLNFLAQYCEAGIVDDDILLEVVMFVGVLCTAETASEIVKSGLCNLLFKLMGDKKEDDEFVLQVAFTFHKLLMFEPTRVALLQHTQGQVVYYLVDLLQDKNKNVRKTASKGLDVIMDTEQAWALDVRTLKFKGYNQEWLEVTEAQDGRGSHGVERDMRIASHFPGDDYYDSDESDDDDYGTSNVITDFEGWQGMGGHDSLAVYN